MKKIMFAFIPLATNPLPPFSNIRNKIYTPVILMVLLKECYLSEKNESREQKP